MNKLKLTSALFILFWAFNLSAAVQCESFFNPTPQFWDLGIGIAPNENNQPEVRLKLSRADTQLSSLWRQKTAALLNWIARPLGNAILKMNTLNEVVQRLEVDERPIPYYHKLAEAFLLKLKFSKSQAAAEIPSEGPAVIIAPHVRAGIDGIALASLTSLYRKKSDVLIVLTARLSELKDLPENAVLIDDMGGPQAGANNKLARRRMENHLAAGGALVIFPSGENAVKKSSSQADPVDIIWKRGLYDLVSAVPLTKIVPVYVDGQLTETFYKIKNISMALSASRLPVEMSTQIGDTIALTIGKTMVGQDILDAAERYVGDREQNSTENLSPSKFDMQRVSVATPARKLLLINTFLSYLRSEVAALKDAPKESFETFTPSEWMLHVD